MICRHCLAPIDTRQDRFVDLGTAPHSNGFLTTEAADRAEWYVPLRAVVCPACTLVQLDMVEPPEQLFGGGYVYHSSYSQSWLQHARTYVVEAVERLDLGPSSFVVEIASNDGYLLQYVAERGVRCLGIEPTESTAAVARSRGIETLAQFFGTACARSVLASHGAADLVIANNVLAHVPDINDFVAGVSVLLAPKGRVSFEFPHLLRLVEASQFDTIYHEHYSYLSFGVVSRILASAGLEVVDVEALSTHGGSLRVWAALRGEHVEPTARVAEMHAVEQRAGMSSPAFYQGFQSRAESIKNDLLTFLIDARRRGQRVVGYGAAAKGNTLLNFCGIRADLLPVVADVSPHKQGLLLPGSRIPVVHPEALTDMRPDYVLILPWNLRDEIEGSLEHLRVSGARFVTAVPTLQIS